VWALAQAGARVEVAARRADRAAALAAETGAVVSPWPPAPGWDLLVNTTPVGTWPRVDEAAIHQGDVRGGAVYDLVYNPPETRLLEWARAAGAETIGGLDMLVSQACLQFEWWTERQAPAAIMAAAAEAFIAERQSRAS
jgi:shikimate 5-dehydrogenase